MVYINNIQFNCVYDGKNKNSEEIKLAISKLIVKLKGFDDEKYFFGDLSTSSLLQSIIDYDTIYTIEYEESIIGTVLLSSYSTLKNRITLAYILDKKYRNKGIGTYIVSEAIRICFEEHKCSKIIAYPSTTNFSSRKVLEKNGFEISNEHETISFSRNKQTDYCNIYSYPYHKYINSKNKELTKKIAL